MKSARGANMSEKDYHNAFQLINHVKSAMKRDGVKANDKTADTPDRIFSMAEESMEPKGRKLNFIKITDGFFAASLNHG